MIDQQVFNNRYRLDRKLGEGGMATVYCGTDTLLRRRVAVKVLREQYAADEDFVRRFYQEAESAAKLSHPNIVNTYDVGCEGKLYYIVMELVDGPTLAEIIAADGKLPEPVAIDYAAQICNGLAYAHRQGLLHRDIKPANVLVTKDDVVKLSDFGIARAVSAQTMALTQPGLVMGSVHYISPEQAQGHSLHESSDLYSVGIMLYQMLTGSLPFTGESPVTVALKHVSDPVPTIDTSVTGTSPALAAIVNRLLQKRPEHRFQSAAEVATALREARERPTRAAYAIHDDAPPQAFSSELPPRRSPMPDRPGTSAPPRRGIGPAWAAVVLIVALAIATGAGYALFGRPLPHLGRQIAVSSYAGMTDRQAEQEIQNAGLVARIVKKSSDTVQMNRVISQNPPPGAALDPNGVVQLFVSNGLPVIGLQDVTGFTFDDATRILAAEKFRVKPAHVFDAHYSKGIVISQRPEANARVRQDSLVTLVVSDGPKPVVLPQLVGMDLNAAKALAAHGGFTLDYTQQAPSSQYPAGTIVAQSIAPGTTLDPSAKTTVQVTISSGATPAPQLGPSVAVPGVVGNAYAAAINALTAAGLVADVAYAVVPGASGTVTAQQPAVQSQAPQNSQVTITVAVPGEVPDIVNLTVGDALAKLAAYGYPNPAIKYTTLEGADGHAVRTEPEAGTAVSPNTTITLYVNGVPH